jgi:hypothetical protein
MIKTVVATGFSCLAIGSITGFFISELTKQPSISQASTMKNAPGPIATESKTAPIPNRADLETRYIKAVNAFGFRIDKANLISLTDKQLNDEVARLESLLRKKS